MMHPVVPLLVALLMPLDALLGQDPLDDLPGFDEPIGASATGGRGGIQVTGVRGFLETRGRVFVKDRRSGDARNDGQWIQELQLELDFALTDNLTGFFRPRFLIDFLDDDLVRTEPLEAYVTWTSEHTDLRVGQMIENWGIADTFNPIDVLNRRDLAEGPIDAARLGELGARWRWFLPAGDVIGEPVISAYFMPVFRTASFPTEQNRYSFGVEPDQLREDLDDRPDGFDRVFLALRAQSTLTTGPANADLQLVVARGPDHFPLLMPVANPGGGVDLLPTYYGMWTIGGGVRAVPNADLLADFTLKAEVVYKIPYRFDGVPSMLPDEYLQYALGFDRPFPNVFSDKDQITTTVEWVGETGADDPTSVFRPFDDDLVLRALWQANDFDRTSLELRGFIDPGKGEWLAEAVYQQQLRGIHEDLQFECGIRWFDVASTEPGFFALFPNNSSIWLSLRFDF